MRLFPRPDVASVRQISLVMLVVCALAAPCAAQTTTPADPADESALRRTVTFLAGGAAGLAMHEAGHLVTGVSFGAHPSVAPLADGPVPFFVITHNDVSRRREFVISSSGFWVQHAVSEWILSARPNVAREHAPFLKGVLAFNVGTSVVYSVAAFARSGPSERDTRGMAVSLGHGGAPEPFIGALVLAPALLDGYRYFKPHSAWAKWTSRGCKVAAVLLTAASRN
jgi:hypothetical protein